jgi:DNA-binding NarL/FixJ family response regulator
MSYWVRPANEPRAADRIDRMRILIVDDHGPFAEALSLTLDSVDEFDVVGTAADAAEAVQLARALRPDVVLMDLQMPGVDGVEATRRVRAAVPEAAVVAVSGGASDEQVEDAFEAGAAAFFPKSGSIDELAGTIAVAAVRRLRPLRRRVLDSVG